jgi:hypothetical protein
MKKAKQADRSWIKQYMKNFMYVSNDRVRTRNSYLPKTQQIHACKVKRIFWLIKIFYNKSLLTGRPNSDVF